MKLHFLLILGLLLFVGYSEAQIPAISRSHVDENVPAEKDFRPLLLRDLEAFLKSRGATGGTIDYELLRDGPTQSGVAYPKFYLWVTVAEQGKTVLQGAARVAAIEKQRFAVTDFLAQNEILADPDALAKIFPAALLPKIRAKAGVRP